MLANSISSHASHASPNPTPVPSGSTGSAGHTTGQGTVAPGLSMQGFAGTTPRAIDALFKLRNALHDARERRDQRQVTALLLSAHTLLEGLAFSMRDHEHAAYEMAMQRGLLHNAAGDPSSAEPAFRMALLKAVSVEQKIKALNNLAVTRGNQGDHAGACDLFGKVYTLVPHAGWALANYVMALSQCGRTDQAVGVLKGHAFTGDSLDAFLLSLRRDPMTQPLREDADFRSWLRGHALQPEQDINTEDENDA